MSAHIKHSHPDQWQGPKAKPKVMPGIQIQQMVLCSGCGVSAPYNEKDGWPREWYEVRVAGGELPGDMNFVFHDWRCANKNLNQAIKDQIDARA